MGWKLWRCYQNGGVDQEGRKQAFVSARYELHRASPIGKCTCTIEKSINGMVFWSPMVILGRVAVAVNRRVVDISHRGQGGGEGEGMALG